MPVEYGIERDVVVLTFRGDTYDVEIREEFDRAWRDPAFPPPPALLLLDVRESTSLGKRSPESMRGLVELVGSLGEDIGQRLAVVASEGVRFGMVRMASAFADLRHLDMRVFTEMEEAREWLRRVSGGGDSG